MKGGSISSVLNNLTGALLGLFKSVTLGLVILIYLLCFHLPLALWAEMLLYTIYYSNCGIWKIIHGDAEGLEKYFINDKSTIVWKGIVKIFTRLFNIIKELFLIIVFIILSIFTLLIPYIFLIYYLIFVTLPGLSKTDQSISE